MEVKWSFVVRTEFYLGNSEAPLLFLCIIPLSGSANSRLNYYITTKELGSREITSESGVNGGSNQALKLGL